MRKMLHKISSDLEKTERGNKAAAQRVRTETIKFAKMAKAFRKESVAAERKGLFKKSPKKKAAKKTKKKATKRKTAKRSVTKRKKTTRRKATKKRRRR